MSPSSAAAWIRRRIIPVGSFIIVTEPLGNNLAKSIMPGRRNCTTSQNVGHYFRMTADDRLVFGGRARSSRRRVCDSASACEHRPARTGASMMLPSTVRWGNSA